MEPDFWLNKWDKNEIAFHGSEANPLLLKYFKELTLTKGSRIFIPLCGKTLDIHWLLSQGYRVAGAELSELAIQQLFTELGVTPKIVTAGKLKHYSAEGIDIFVGDIFDLTADLLGAVDAVYDRAALVALPEEMRIRYTAHLARITDKAPQLLITYEYDATLISGPPFSISIDEVKRHYAGSYNLHLLASIDTPDGLRGNAARENVWVLGKN
jgi:thiopurine S-methyltransferase